MAKTPEARAQVRASYVHKKLPIEACVVKLRPKVSVGTARRWKSEAKKAGDDWDRARAASHLAGQGAEAVTEAVLEDFVALFQSVMSELNADQEASALAKAEAISRLSDAYQKVMSAVSKGSPKLSKLAIAMETLELFARFVQVNFPKHAPAFLEVLEPFGAELTKTLGN